MASEVSPNWLRSVPSCTSRVAGRQALGPLLSSFPAPMGVTPFDWSRGPGIKNPDFGFKPKDRDRQNCLARPFSDLFNVAASRPAKSPRGALMPPGSGSRQALVVSTRRNGKEKRNDGGGAEQGPRGVKPVPSMKRCAAIGAGLRQVGPHQLVVDRLHDQERPGPRRQNEQRADEEGGDAGQPPGDGAEEKCEHRQGRLHDEATSVRRLPLRQQRFVIQLQPGGLLGEIDVEGRSAEQRGHDESEMSYVHYRPTQV